MTKLAKRRNTPVVAHRCLLVACLARNNAVDPEEGKSGAGVLCDETDRPPVVLSVAAPTIEAHVGLVRIHMAAAAASCDVGLDGSPVVVTT